MRGMNRAFLPRSAAAAGAAGSDRIAPRVLKGFHDLLPAVEQPRRRYLEALERVVRGYGFVPIDTPALEYADVLLAKAGGETEAQIYRFRDHGDRDVALRFDLTVPFARFMALHARELHTPFKRYQFGKVWRGENTQRGRYREFSQFDADIVGVDTAAADLETLLLVADCVGALNLGPFTLRVSHRGVVNRLLQRLGLADRAVAIMRLIDKLDTRGAAATRAALAELVGAADGEQLMRFVQRGADNAATLASMRAAAGDGADLTRLDQLVSWTGEHAALAQVLVVDPAIMRGLDYYTGLVFETVLSAAPEVGSVCSGGRYDDLVSLYAPERLPGIGLSIGLDRIVLSLHAAGKLPAAEPSADVVIFCLDEALAARYQRLATELRAAGLAVDVYPTGRKLKAQFAYAERRAIRAALFLGPDEVARGRFSVRDLNTRQEWTDLDTAAAIRTLLQLRTGCSGGGAQVSL